MTTEYYLVHCYQLNSVLYLVYLLFKPGACRPEAGAPGFLKLILRRLLVCVCVCVCPRPRLLITSGLKWRDIDLI